jgi:hypothetical protein
LSRANAALAAGRDIAKSPRLVKNVLLLSLLAVGVMSMY